MPNSTPTVVCAPANLFGREELAFARAWEVYAPGLGGWRVEHDVEGHNGDTLLVDPPLVYGDGFTLRPHAGTVVITSPLGTHTAPTLREALLLICPLGREQLEAVELLAAAPEPAF